MPVGFLFLSTFVMGQPAEPAWHTDLAKARQESLKTDKPVFVILH